MIKPLNKWLESYRRSFDSIKFKLLSDLDNIKDDKGMPLITDKSEGNIFVLIISMFSAIAEVLHYYIDKTGMESFLPTAQRYTSLVKHAKLVDYHIKGATASQVTVNLSRDVDSNNTSVKLAKNVSIKDSQGNEWFSKHDSVMSSNETFKTLTLIQHSPVQDNTHSLAELVNGRYIVLTPGGNDLYEEGSMSMKVGSEEYALVETFAKSSPSDKHFMVEISGSSNDANLMIIFGDGVNGYKPSSANGDAIELSYYVTKGSNGNINAESINTTWPTDPNIQMVNPLASGGGSNYEDFDTLKDRIQNSIKTLDVAITKEDFKDLALTRPGVGQVAIEYECGRKLNIYLAPIEGIDASGLCEDVKNYILQHCPLTTWVDVKPVGITPIVLEATITGKKSYKKDYIQNQVITALNNRYSAGNTKINEAVRLSDIYALIDNLESVDYLLITKFYLMPWPKRLSGGTQLSINTYTLNKCNTPQEYILVKKNGTWEVYSKYNNNSNLQNGVGNDINVEDVNNGNSFTLKLDNVPEDGSRYSIYVTYGESTTQDPGFNLPVINTNSNQVILNINETL